MWYVSPFKKEIMELSDTWNFWKLCVISILNPRSRLNLKMRDKTAGGIRKNSKESDRDTARIIRHKISWLWCDEIGFKWRPDFDHVDLNYKICLWQLGNETKGCTAISRLNLTTRAGNLRNLHHSAHSRRDVRRENLYKRYHHQDWRVIGPEN